MSIIVVGSLNMDLIVRTPRIPAPGETILGHTFSTAPGGKGANQAVAAAKLGAPVKLIGRVGADDFGKQLRSQLNAVGVDAQFVFEDAQAASGVALISVDDQGQNSIIVAPGANGRVTRQDVDSAREAIRAARVVIAQLEIPLDSVTYALRVAHNAGALTILNPAPARQLSSELLQNVDVIIPNETEAALLTGLPVHDFDSATQAAHALQQMGARTVIITLGEKGALWLNENAVAQQVTPFQVQVVDTTAAGDAFVGALGVALAREQDWETSLRTASAAGALAATKLGAQPSLPTRAELEEFLAGTP
ncbi:MAG: ribokinase [Chloroflexota bacterium]|nr:MAG: ribokinase [Chloroflexota bacterium]